MELDKAINEAMLELRLAADCKCDSVCLRRISRILNNFHTLLSISEQINIFIVRNVMRIKCRAPAVLLIWHIITLISITFCDKTINFIEYTTNRRDNGRHNQAMLH
jgi:hypothetical protein